MARIKKNCQNPGHPFSQKWYWYDERFDHSEFCSSCWHFLETMSVIIKAIIIPHNTLYADREIKLTKEQAIEFVSRAYDEL